MDDHTLSVSLDDAPSIVLDAAVAAGDEWFPRVLLLRESVTPCGGAGWCVTLGWRRANRGGAPRAVVASMLVSTGRYPAPASKLWDRHV